MTFWENSVTILSWHKFGTRKKGRLKKLQTGTQRLFCIPSRTRDRTLFAVGSSLWWFHPICPLGVHTSHWVSLSKTQHPLSHVEWRCITNPTEKPFLEIFFTSHVSFKIKSCIAPPSKPSKKNTDVRKKKTLRCQQTSNKDKQTGTGAVSTRLSVLPHTHMITLSSHMVFLPLCGTGGGAEARRSTDLLLFLQKLPQTPSPRTQQTEKSSQ